MQVVPEGSRCIHDRESDDARFEVSLRNTGEDERTVTVTPVRRFSGGDEVGSSIEGFEVTVPGNGEEAGAILVNDVADDLTACLVRLDGGEPIEVEHAGGRQPDPRRGAGLRSLRSGPPATFAPEPLAAAWKRGKLDCGRDPRKAGIGHAPEASMVEDERRLAMQHRAVMRARRVAMLEDRCDGRRALRPRAARDGGREIAGPGRRRRPVVAAGRVEQASARRRRRRRVAEAADVHRSPRVPGNLPQGQLVAVLHEDALGHLTAPAGADLDRDRAAAIGWVGVQAGGAPEDGALVGPAAVANSLSRLRKTREVSNSTSIRRPALSIA